MSISDEPTAPSSPPAAPKSAESIQRAQSAIQSLSHIIGHIPMNHISSSEDPALALLNDPAIAFAVSHHLHQPISGSGDDNICRWFYDTFQSTDPSLQLVVLRFLPIVGGLYLTRCARRHGQPLAGFEAVLLALYARETVAREGKPLSIDLPNLSAPSPYHEAKATSLKSNRNAEEPAVATGVISAALEPHGTVRSTKRARIVGVALELYYDNVSDMPVESKIEFCRFAADWAGHYGSPEKEPKNEVEKEESAADEIEGGEEKKEEGVSDVSPGEGEGEENEGRITLPWEMFLPTLRIVGHCLLGNTGSEVLRAAAMAAARGLYERAMHDMNPQALLASRSLMRLGMMGPDIIADPSLPSVYSEAPASEPADSHRSLHDR